MNQIPIKSTCNACQGEGVLSTGKIFTLTGCEHPLFTQCTACEGKGTLLTWVDVHQLAQMLNAIAAEEQAE
jgi:DnaJ-class molecular chaperone